MQWDSNSAWIGREVFVRFRSRALHGLGRGFCVIGIFDRISLPSLMQR